MKTQKCLVLPLENIEEMVTHSLQHINGIETVEAFIYDFTEIEVIITLSMDDKVLARQVSLALGIVNSEEVYEGEGVVRIFGKDVMKMLPVEFNGTNFYPKVEPSEVCFIVEETTFNQKLMKLIVLAAGQMQISWSNSDETEEDDDTERMDALHDVEYPIAESVIELMKEHNINPDDVTGDTLSECIWEVLCDIY